MVPCCMRENGDYFVTVTSTVSVSVGFLFCWKSSEIIGVCVVISAILHISEDSASTNYSETELETHDFLFNVP